MTDSISLLKYHMKNCDKWLQEIQSFMTSKNVNLQLNINSKPTYLHLAARRGYSIAISWLVEECGANVNVCDDLGETPLYDAIQCWEVQVVRQLLSYGARVDVTNKRNKSPLHYIFDYRDRGMNDQQREIIRLLLDSGAKLEWVSMECHLPEWAKTLADGRELCRQVCVTVLGLRRYRHSVLNTNVKDIICVIAKCVWRTRLNWEEL